MTTADVQDVRYWLTDDGYRALGVEPRKCRVCGCTDDHACEGGCAWVSPDEDLCTACVRPVEDSAREPHLVVVETCTACGAAGPCAIDADGRPLIHTDTILPGG